LAEAYGQLIKDMWSGEFSVVSPTEFKLQIGKKAPQFQGYQQQDSQELMSFLMDGLNEDLNRVLKKPFVEAVESDGRPDEIVAALSWEGYKKRNDSVVVDNFAGLLRSHVKCNVCDRESTTFDPFMSLSVPIPTKDTKPFVVRCP
jgi:ubiquitin carboxyl-terminal hydrolase 4/11